MEKELVPLSNDGMPSSTEDEEKAGGEDEYNGENDESEPHYDLHSDDD